MILSLNNFLEFHLPMFKRHDMKAGYIIIFATMLIASCSSDVEKCAEAHVVAAKADNLSDAEVKAVRADAYAFCLRASKGE